MALEPGKTDRTSVPLTPSTSRTVAWVLGAAICCLTAASTLSQLYRFTVRDGQSRGWIERLYLDREQSIPTWFQAATLLACAGLLHAIARAKRRNHDRHTRAWRGLALIFLLLSLDEVAGLHEVTSAPLRAALHADGLFRFAWVVPGTAFASVIGLLYVRFLIDLAPVTRWQVLVAAALYVGGAVGMEMISGAYVSAHGVDTPAYAIGLVTLEELLEMLGMSLFCYTLVSYLGRQVEPVKDRR